MQNQRIFIQIQDYESVFTVFIQINVKQFIFDILLWKTLCTLMQFSSFILRPTIYSPFDISMP